MVYRMYFQYRKLLYGVLVFGVPFLIICTVTFIYHHEWPAAVSNLLCAALTTWWAVSRLRRP